MLPCQVSVAVYVVPAACVSAATGTVKVVPDVIVAWSVSVSRLVWATVAPDALRTTTSSESLFVVLTVPTGVMATPRRRPVTGTATVTDWPGLSS